MARFNPFLDQDSSPAGEKPGLKLASARIGNLDASVRIPADKAGTGSCAQAALPKLEIISGAANGTKINSPLCLAPPRDEEFTKSISKAIVQQDRKMKGTGHCALAVQRALARAGLPQFMGVGNAWQMLGPLEKSELFVRIPESEADVGDLLVRPPSKVRARRSRHGDISVVTARKGDTIKQTNDSTYIYKPENPRYDGKAVFLRYAPDHRIWEIANEEAKKK